MEALEVTPDCRYRLDPSRVVHETVEGETILIDLKTGCYYSLLGSGPQIWSLATRGHSAREIGASLAQAHSHPLPEVQDAVLGLLARLTEEGLVSPDEGVEPVEVAPSPPPNGSFVAPSLEKYEDMQDYLLVDPVHQVDAGGWPNARPA